MRLTIAYFKIKKRNLVLINNATYQRETVSERPIRQPLRKASIAIECSYSDQTPFRDQISNLAPFTQIRL